MASGKALQITDHAVLRYIERIRGVDVEAIRAQLQPNPRCREAIEVLDDEMRVHKHDCTLVVKNCTVITVLPKRGKCE